MIVTNTSQLSRQSWLEHPHYEIFGNKSIVTADGGDRAMAMGDDGRGGGGQPIGSHGINAFAYTIFGIGHLFILLIYRKLTATAIIQAETATDHMSHFCWPPAGISANPATRRPHS